MAKPKFRSVPQPRSEDEFVAGAEQVDSVEPTGAETTKARAIDVVRSSPNSTARPWVGLDPDAAPTVNTTVRLNDYQHAQLSHLAHLDDRSQSQILRRLLGPALETAIVELEE